MSGTPAGVLVALKLPGPTSHDVVARARRLLGLQRVGHGGTLDPPAAGVLPLLVGSAARLARYLTLGDKEYRFTLAFGCETDTGDQLGRPVRTAPPPRREALEAALPAFTGEIRQRPPAFSAVKVGGRRAYELAREGRPAEVAERRVSVEALTLLEWRPGPPVEALLSVRCSHGTYVRSLAADLARAAGSAGHVSALLRTRTGPFTLAAALTLDEAAAALRAGRPVLRPPLEVLYGRPRVDVSSNEAEDVARGRWPRGLAARLWAAGAGAVEAEPGDAAVVYEGRLLAVAGRREGRWRWTAVFPEALP
ncbi:MAG: tRNA pseudouridine(55) synthase TruB [Firmicutes bacterium]|nr:tRNA pseudouridine(55) synthase TruB [Bacillota bacterium]